MKHFFHNGLSRETGQLEVRGKDLHYLKNVRRLKPGDSFPGLGPGGCRYLLKLQEDKGESLLLEAIFEEDSGVDTEIVLYQCLLKGKKMDTVIRQATEAGIHSIVPLESDHSVVKIKDLKKIEEKIDRWERIAREGVQQSGNFRVPRIETPVKLKNLFFPGGVNLFFHQVEIEGRSLHNYLAGNPGLVSLFVGPEGGFSEGEVELFKSAGAGPVFLGPFVLRAETAAVYALGAVRTILHEKKHWRVH